MLYSAPGSRADSPTQDIISNAAASCLLSRRRSGEALEQIESGQLIPPSRRQSLLAAYSPAGSATLSPLLGARGAVSTTLAPSPVGEKFSFGNENQIEIIESNNVLGRMSIITASTGGYDDNEKADYGELAAELAKLVEEEDELNKKKNALSSENGNKNSTGKPYIQKDKSKKYLEEDNGKYDEESYRKKDDSGSSENESEEDISFDGQIPKSVRKLLKQLAAGGRNPVIIPLIINNNNIPNRRAEDESEEWNKKRHGRPHRLNDWNNPFPPFFQSSMFQQPMFQPPMFPPQQPPFGGPPTFAQHSNLPGGPLGGGLPGNTNPFLSQLNRGVSPNQFPNSPSNHVPPFGQPNQFYPPQQQPNQVNPQGADGNDVKKVN
uniref:Uncharacterized protein n=1 Tax=Meloidogyne javanica TaxID=6303 RepID=A0A915LTD6_MELJA